MRTRVIGFTSLSDLIEEVELMEKIDKMSIEEFVAFCDAMSSEEFWQFCGWLDKWGLL